MMRSIAAGLLVLILQLTPAESRTQWTLTEPSTLSFVAMQADQPVEGVFRAFTGAIVFSDHDLAASSVEIAIDVARLDTGQGDRDDTLRSDAFFDAARWPVARFRSTEFRRIGDQVYEALGALTIRDRTRPVPLRFTLDPSPGAGADGLEARVSGRVVINRLEFGVGQGMWADTSVIADKVEIRVELTATANDANWRARLGE